VHHSLFAPFDLVPDRVHREQLDRAERIRRALRAARAQHAGHPDATAGDFADANEAGW